MPRVALLLPSATYRAPDFMRAAAALGVEVVVASDRRQALAPLMGDRAIRLDLDYPEEAAARLVALARASRMDAIVAVDDRGVVTAAIAGARLGLPHNDPEAVRATRDKAEQRRRLATAGLPQPRFRVLADGEDPTAAVAEVGFPCVLKPVGLSGSRGVIRADDPASAQDAVQRIRTLLAGDGLPTSPLLIESFVPGQEVAVEGLLREGRLEILAIFDKPDPLDGPFFEETIYVTPSRAPADVQERIATAAQAAATALGLREGPVHAELRLHMEQVTVLELAARTIGGLCARTLRFGAGVSLEEIVLRHALGLDPGPHERERGATGVMMIPIPSDGVLEAVEGLDAAGAVPGIEGVEITIRPGRPVVPLPEGDRYLGFLFARAQEPADVERALRAAHGLLDIRIAPQTAAAAAGSRCR